MSIKLSIKFSWLILLGDPGLVYILERSCGGGQVDVSSGARPAPSRCTRAHRLTSSPPHHRYQAQGEVWRVEGISSNCRPRQHGR